MSDINFSKAELERYSRHLIIPEFNIEGQRRLKAARVLVVGAGGLGSPLLQYLAAAGIGTIGIVDFDVVEDSNLQRQTLFGTSDLGLPKVEAARKRILDLNPHIEVHTYETALNSENALEIIESYDVVADGTDNFPTRYLVNDACVLLGKTNVYASIFRFDGQVAVFNYPDSETGIRGPNYRDLYAAPPPPGMVPSCAEGGVLGVLPGIIGSLQANEVIKVVSGVGTPLTGKLFLFDALSFSNRLLNVRKDPSNPLTGDSPSQTGLIDYEYFCGLGESITSEEVPEISVQELASWQTNGASFQLIDVREPYEFDIANLGGILIPLGHLSDNTRKISKDEKVVVHCRSGKRSLQAVSELRGLGYGNVYNLKGGILAFSKEIDPSIPQY